MVSDLWKAEASSSVWLRPECAYSWWGQPCRGGGEEAKAHSTGCFCCSGWEHLGWGVGGSAVTHVSPVAYISSSHLSEDPALKSVIRRLCFYK